MYMVGPEPLDQPVGHLRGYLCTWLDQNLLVNQLATCVVMYMVGPEPLGQPVGHLRGYVHLCVYFYFYFYRTPPSRTLVLCVLLSPM